MQAEDYYDYPAPMKRWGVFRPKRTDDLRDCMRPIVGKRLLFEFAGWSGDDEPYAGQRRWMISRQDGIEDEHVYRWVPDEDIDFDDSSAASR